MWGISQLWIMCAIKNWTFSWTPCEMVGGGRALYNCFQGLFYFRIDPTFCKWLKIWSYGRYWIWCSCLYICTKLKFYFGWNFEILHFNKMALYRLVWLMKKTLNSPIMSIEPSGLHQFHCHGSFENKVWKIIV